MVSGVVGKQFFGYFGIFAMINRSFERIS